MHAEPDADRYADIKLRLRCPHCGSTGLVPLEQLDQMLFCFGCQQRYRVERQRLVELPGDRVGVQVRTHLSEWQGHEAILTNRRSPLGGWLLQWLIGFLTRGAAPWAALVLSLLIVGDWIALGNRGPEEKPPLVIPDSLVPRAEMFSQALARRDMEVMIRLTDPAQHRALRIWLAHGSDVPPQAGTDQTDLTAKVIVTKANPAGDRVELRVQLAQDGRPVVLDQQWAQVAHGAWYFQPVRLRSANTFKGQVVPYSKQRRRG